MLNIYLFMVKKMRLKKHKFIITDLKKSIFRETNLKVREKKEEKQPSFLYKVICRLVFVEPFFYYPQ